LAVNGVNATSFEIYIFGINTAAFDSKYLLDVALNVPDGTFAVGFGWYGHQNSHWLIHPFSTPFTEAGFGGSDNPESGPTVPEPASLLLIGTGLAGLGIVAWRKRNR
jgi:hypothetical protein